MVEEDPGDKLPVWDGQLVGAALSCGTARVTGSQGGCLPQPQMHSPPASLSGVGRCEMVKRCFWKLLYFVKLVEAFSLEAKQLSCCGMFGWIEPQDK